jgi:hypothetical protein
LESIVRRSCGGEMPPVVWGGSSARQTFSPVVSTSMSCAQSSGVTMSCADSSRATPSHARYRARRQRTGERHRAVASRARASAAAPPPPLLAAAVHDSPRAIGWPIVRPLRSRCRSRWLTQPLRQLALRYDGLLLPWDTSAAVPSAGRDAVAREAASTAPAGPYRRYRPSASRPIASDQQLSSRGPSGAK